LLLLTHAALHEQKVAAASSKAKETKEAKEAKTVKTKAPVKKAPAKKTVAAEKK